MARDPFILIPGLLNDEELWRDQWLEIGKSRPCEVADITKAASIEAMAHDVLAAAPENFALAGFSLGGYVAQEILRQAPQRITRLALLDTAIKRDSAERTEMRRALDNAARSSGKFHGFGERLLDTYLAPVNRGNEAIVSRIRGMTERLGPQVFVRQNGVERKDGRDVLSTFHKPLLILCGREDRLTPVADHLAMAEIAPFAVLKIVPGAGHMTPIEAPEAVTVALLRWLSLGFNEG